MQILSHRWGREEVTFQDLCDDTGPRKHGYHKIRFCSEQARRDNLSYFWVDTCCIDKKNAVELQEAINSMFRWYRDAARCYVYLEDVSYPATQPPRRAAMARVVSKQPLVHPWVDAPGASAPASVEFFSGEGTPLGNKHSLESIICDDNKNSSGRFKRRPSVVRVLGRGPIFLDGPPRDHARRR